MLLKAKSFTIVKVNIIFMTEYIFLTGHRKSGTTLLHKLFDGCEHLNIYPVDLSLLYAFLPCKNKELSINEWKSRIDLVLTKSLSSIENSPIPPSNKIFKINNFLKVFWNHHEPRNLTKDISILDAISESWCTYLDLNHKLPFLIKETSQSIYSLELHKKNKDIKYIQIIRDPRDNYSSIKSGVSSYYNKMSENEMESLASLINRARMDFLIGNQLKTAYESWFKCIKFEDLVYNPKDMMFNLSQFLNIKFDLNFIKPTFLGKPFFGNNYQKKLDGISKENVGRWTERISEFEAGVIEYWLQDVMKLFGYEFSMTSDKASIFFSDFYKWYNCRYFYRDSFSNDIQKYRYTEIKK